MGHNVLESDSFVWKFMLILGGIYIFFIFEIMMHIFTNKHGHSHKVEEDDSLVSLHHLIHCFNTVHLSKLLPQHKKSISFYLIFFHLYSPLHLRI